MNATLNDALSFLVKGLEKEIGLKCRCPEVVTDLKDFVQIDLTFRTPTFIDVLQVTISWTPGGWYCGSSTHLNAIRMVNTAIRVIHSGAKSRRGERPSTLATALAADDALNM